MTFPTNRRAVTQSKPPPVEYISFGAGPPSLALCILNATGRVMGVDGRKVTLILFADTGGEKAATYANLPLYADWFAEMGMEFTQVQSKDGPLPEYLTNRSVAIPVHTVTAIGRRQCTDSWKIDPVERYLHRRFGRNTPLIAQLGLHTGEMHRLRNPRVQRNQNRWPLVEMRMGRQACIDLIRETGLPLPPWSACSFCPIQKDGHWRLLASEHPEDFRKAIALDEALRERSAATGKDPIWLHHSRRPLADVFSVDQLAFAMPVYDSNGEESCERFNCFT